MTSPAPVTIVMNPASGPAGRRGRQARLVSARALLAAADPSAELLVTEGRGHALSLARAAVERGAPVVCAWGGDGTVNEVGRAVIGSAAALGIVPAGSGNGLACALGLPADPAAALAAVLRGRERRLDAGEIEGRLFFSVAGVGLDARVAAQFDAQGQGGRGQARYVTLAARELLRARAESFTIRVDGDVLRVRALLVACANGGYYGRRARIAPAARPDDGQLDLVIVEPRSLLRAAAGAVHLARGSLDRVPGLRSRSFRTAEIAGDGPQAYHADGEPFVGGRAVIVRVLPALLRVRVP